MANAPINGTTLRRRPTTFTPQPSKDEPNPGPVTYFEALIIEDETGDLYVLRSGTKADLDAFEVGKPVKGAAVRFDKPTNVRATLVRPIRDDQGQGKDW